MSGQRVSDCVSEIHRTLGKKIHVESFNILNYSDDYAGCQDSFELAMLSFTSLSSLLLELGLEESSDKAVSPPTTMLYLGVEYDTVKMEMRIGQEKCKEMRLESLSINKIFTSYQGVNVFSRMLAGYSYSKAFDINSFARTSSE